MASVPLSTASSDDGYTSEEEYERLQQEWEESLQQLQLLASVVLLPFLGKYLGRKWSHWGQPSAFLSFAMTIDITIAYARYLRLGLGSAFFLGENRS